MATTDFKWDDLKMEEAPSASAPAPQATKTTSDNSAAYPPGHFTDLATGERYSKEIAGKYLHVFEWKGWAEYSAEEGIWAPDTSNRVHKRLYAYLKDQFEKVLVDGDKFEKIKAEALMSRPRALNVLNVAGDEATVSSKVFDQKRDHLLVGNGVLDLRTGDVTAVGPEDLFTKRSDVAYRPDAKSPLLKKLLGAFPDDAHDYLQVLAGQSLTGYQPSTRDASVFFFNGDGKNGKSTFMDCLQRIAGTSAVQLEPSVLLSSTGNANQFAFMPFKGARLAVFEELPDARHLDAQAVKSIAGTSKKRASEKFQKSEEVEIAATVFIATNFLPAVAETDLGTWRRLVVIPSPYTFVDEADFDPTNPTHRLLTPELVDAKDNTALLEALMAWAVEGAKKWYANGRKLLPQPASIASASAKWQNRDDKLGSWLEEELVASEKSFVLVADAYDSYVAYTRANGQIPQNSTRWLASFKQSPTAREMGAEAGKSRLKKLTRSLYVPEQRYKAKADGDYTKHYVPREVGEQANVIKGVCFKNDALAQTTASDDAKRLTHTRRRASDTDDLVVFDPDMELTF